MRNQERFKIEEQSKLLWIPRTLVVICFAIIYILNVITDQSFHTFISWFFFLTVILYILSYFNAILSGILFVTFACIIIFIESFTLFPMSILILAGLLLIIFQNQSTKIHW